MNTDILTMKNIADRRFLATAVPVRSYDTPSLADALKQFYRPELKIERAKMLDHLKEMNKSLQVQGVSPAYFESDDAAMLSWYDASDALNSVAVRLDKGTGVWSSVKGGDVLGRTDFDTLDSFLSFSIV